MQGSINFDGTLSGSIAGGGGGGSEVTITPTLQSGTKIADYQIDEDTGSLYAPTPPTVPEHIVTDIYGFNYTPYPSTEVARYTIDNGEEQSIRTPDYSTTWEAYPGVAQDYTIGILSCYGSTFYVKIPNYQKPLTAGANITIDSDNVISASSGVDYSTSEQDTGRKWIDGKTIYRRTFSITPITLSSGGSPINEIDMTGADMFISGFASYSVTSNAKCIPLSIWRYNNVVQYAGMAAYVDTITIEYTKQ